MERSATPPRSLATLDDLVPRLRSFFEERNVLKAIVFGSFARGTNTRRSDLDLALILETNKRFLERYEHIRGIENALPPNVHAEVLVYVPGELDAISHRPFVQRMLAEGVVIFER